jgi:hypothetical protein
LGSWEVAEEQSYVRVVLNADGSCVFVAGSILGDKRDGIGGRCRYSAKNNAISITEMREIDGSGKVETLPQPIRLRYDAKSDSVSFLDQSKLRLSRISKAEK